eukprot:1782780-Pyramimonas_sp.AAC.1
MGAQGSGGCPRDVGDVQAEGALQRTMACEGECAEEERGAPVSAVQEECRAVEPRALGARGACNGWRRQQADRARVLRVLRQMKWWYESRGRVWRGRGLLAEVNTLEQLKAHMVVHCPDSEADLEIRGESEHDALWDRL